MPFCSHAGTDLHPKSFQVQLDPSTPTVFDSTRMRGVHTAPNACETPYLVDTNGLDDAGRRFAVCGCGSSALIQHSLRRAALPHNGVLQRHPFGKTNGV